MIPFLISIGLPYYLLVPSRLGLTSDREHSASLSRNDEDDAESSEALPLYQDMNIVDVSPRELHPPDPRASPHQVRDYLVRLLMRTKGLDLDCARRIASKWTRGTGRDLSSYPPLLFVELFGYEDGWTIYKQSRLHAAALREKKFWNRFGLYIGFGAMLLVEIAAITILANQAADPLFRVVAMLVSIIDGITLIGLLGVIMSRKDPETIIEGDLRVGLAFYQGRR